MKRIISLLLCLLMLIYAAFCVGGCSASDEDTDTSGEAPLDTGDPLYADLPAGDFRDASGNPYEFNILNVESNYGLSMMDSDNMASAYDSAVYARNRTVESTLGIKITVTDMPFADNYSAISTLASAGDYVYDICYNEAWEQSLLVQSGVYHSVNKYGNYLNFEKPWWYSSVINDLSVFGNSFLVAGDMNMMYNDSLWCVAVNKEIIEKHNATSPYTLVDSGNWTYDTMYQLCVDTWEENENNPTYGTVSWTRFANAMIAAADIKLIAKDNTNGLVQNEVSNRFIEVYNKLNTLFFTNNGDGKLMGVRASDKSSNYVNFSDELKSFQKMFTTGRATFMGGTVGDMRTYLPSSGVDYGIVPMPKYETEQEQYISYVYEGAALCGIPTAASDTHINRTCTVLEWLCAYSYKNVKSVYYEIILQARVAQDPTSVEMLDIIFGINEKGRTYIELDSMMKLGLASIIEVKLSDNSTAINSALSAQKIKIDKTLLTTVKAYQQ